MREYVLKKGNKDYVPKDVMMQVKYRLHGYERIRKELKELQRRNPPGQSDGATTPHPSPAVTPSPPGGRLTREERKRLKAFEKEVVLIDEACTEMAARLKSYADENFDCISAYFSYEHYNLHITRSDAPDDGGASPHKWSGYKRQFTRIIADKLGIVW